MWVVQNMQDQVLSLPKARVEDEEMVCQFFPKFDASAVFRKQHYKTAV